MTTEREAFEKWENETFPRGLSVASLQEALWLGWQGRAHLSIHLSEPADARDAARFAWWFNYIAKESAAGIDAWRAKCDAAMARESA